MANLMILSSILAERFPDNSFVNLFASYSEQRRLNGGLMFFITRPESFVDPFLLNNTNDMIRVVTYSLFMLTTCVMLS